MLEQIDSLEDTIVACATPSGEGAIAVVRLSGGRAREIAGELAPRNMPVESHKLVVASLFDRAGRVLDRGMVVEMHAPRSFTGEDVVELHLHGSRAVVEAVLQACLEHGARLARAGEFSLRAFVNGRMDLAQAEALCDLITARDAVEHQIAAAQLMGSLSRQVNELIGELEEIIADWRVGLDFPEHVQDDHEETEHTEKIQEIGCRIQKTYERSRREGLGGLRVTLCGAANVGKSTLLNAWVGEERVLVDREPGTTRDPVEVELSQGLIRWSVCDTAGLGDRARASDLEERGMAMSLDRIRRSDIAVWLVCPDAPVWPPDQIIVRVVGSKSDLASDTRRQELEEIARERGLEIATWISPRYGEGVQELRGEIVGRYDQPALEGATAVRQRHVEALRCSLEALERLEAGRKAGATLDVLCMDLEESARSLGRIVGRDVDATILERIFSEFCVGK